MKKFMCLFLVLVCIVGCFCACGKAETGNTKNNSEVSENIKTKNVKTTKKNAEIDKNLASKIKEDRYQEVITNDAEKWKEKVNDPNDMSFPTQLKRKYPFLPGTIRYFMSIKDTEIKNIENGTETPVPAYTFFAGSSNSNGYIYYDNGIYYGGLDVDTVQMAEYYITSPIDKYDQIDGKTIGQVNNELIFAFYPEHAEPAEPHWCYCVDLNGNSFYFYDELKENVLVSYNGLGASYRNNKELPLLPFEFNNMDQFLKQFTIKELVCIHNLTPSEGQREYSVYPQGFFTEEDAKQKNREFIPFNGYILEENS